MGRFGGFVAKYMGDGVLIYFGYPQAHEYDAERAVRAGLELIAAASRLPSRTTHATLGASAVRYSFTVTDFHRLPLAGLPAHPSTHEVAVDRAG